MKKRQPPLYIMVFMDEIKDYARDEMLQRIEEKLLEEATKIQELKVTRYHEELSRNLNFYHNLKSLKYFLETGTKSEITDTKTFKRFEWIAQKLVQRQEFEDHVLDLFQI